MHEGSISILWKDCKQESESENIVKYVELDIFVYSKAYASAENIVAPSVSLAENTSFLITAAAATLFLSFEQSV